MTDRSPRQVQLLDEAVGYVLQHGVGALTLRPLAAALGTSDRMLVYHFGSKEVLVDSVVETAGARLVELLTARWPRARTPGGVVRGYWRLVRAPDLEPFVRLWLELRALAAREPGRWAALQDRVTEPWLALMADALRAAGSTPAQARRQAPLVVAALDGLLLDLRASESERRVEAAVRELATLVEGGRA